MGNMWFLASGSSAAASSGSGSGNYTFLILIIALFAVMYFVMIRPQRNRQRQAQQMQRDVTPGRRVRTTAGMYATVTSIEGDDVVLEIAPGIEVRYLRRAIMEVIPDDSGFAAAEPPDTGEATMGAETGGSENGKVAN